MGSKPSDCVERARARAFAGSPVGSTAQWDRGVGSAVRRTRSHNMDLAQPCHGDETAPLLGGLGQLKPKNIGPGGKHRAYPDWMAPCRAWDCAEMPSQEPQAGQPSPVATSAPVAPLQEATEMQSARTTRDCWSKRKQANGSNLSGVPRILNAISSPYAAKVFSKAGCAFV